MGFQPNGQLNILEDALFAQAMDAVREELARHRCEGFFEGVDGAKIYYEYVLCDGAKGSVVLLHGMSEFTCKHYELAWYLLHQGYSVFLYDHRCHGKSQRLTEQMDLIHVDHFDDYVQDLDIFVKTVVQEVAAAPLYLYGHSMGGAVAVRYLAEHPAVFRRAVLSSPLFEPIVGVPTPLAAISAAKDQLLRGPKSKLTHSREFVAKMPEEWEHDPKCSRNKYMMQLRMDEPCYRSTPMSARFALRALYQTPKLLGLAKKISTPHLLISGEEDTVIKVRPHSRYAKRAPMCSFVSIPGGKHAMMCDDAASAAVHTHLVLDFLQEGTL